MSDYGFEGASAREANLKAMYRTKFARERIRCPHCHAKPGMWCVGLLPPLLHERRLALAPINPSREAANPYSGSH